MRHILEWVDINEQIPGLKQECVVQFKSGEVQGGWLYGGQSQGGTHFFVESHAEYEISMDVTFWMSLPPGHQNAELIINRADV
ncbi:hypothetical protein [Pantoea sp.]|uniref:hypothetical protein n=1 Tax=Pantoea sp. TaxID=69393 RepID=UPI0028A6683E|nr:hypothetical protein [Pantoea sp.]